MDRIGGPDRRLAAWACSVLMAGLANAVWAEEIRPNIVIIVVDDLGYAELGCQGNTDVPTPQIDSIAERGVRFTNGYVTASFCAPSRAGLLTGRHQAKFGFNVNPIGAQNADPSVGLPLSETTLAQALQLHGYATGLVGKWHQGGTAEYHPLRRGFDEFFGFLHEGHYYVPPPFENVTTWLRRRVLPDGSQGRWTSADGRLVLSTHMGSHEPAYDAGNPLLLGSQPVSEPLYLTDAFARESCSFIERHAERPYFLYLAFNAVHSPMQAQQKYMSRFANIDDVHRRIFAAMLSNLDDAVGQVLAAVRESKRPTLIFLLSDNGGPTAELTSSNTPLRGGKGTLYEGGIRVPFLMQWPGRIEPCIYEHPVSALDIVPTCLHAAGVESRQSFDGVSLLPFLAGESQDRPHAVLYWSQGKRGAMRSEDWKLVLSPGPSDSMTKELYNLSEDVGEQQDVSGTYAVHAEELWRQWTEWQSEAKAR